MNAYIYRERAAKVAVISSIAKSQEALAGILGNISDLTAHSDSTARKLAENIRVLNAYQSMMVEMLTGIQLNRAKLGVPQSPWLNPMCQYISEDRNLEVKEDPM